MKIIDIPDGRIIIAPVPFPGAEESLDRADRDRIAAFGSPRRRAEAAAWRAVVRREMQLAETETAYGGMDLPNCIGESLPAESIAGSGQSAGIGISYSDVGAPVVSGSGKWTHIGVSHSRGRVAVIFSDSPCAIDMEGAERDFSRAANKYISKEESRIQGSDNPLFRAAVWCAKETLYKFSGRTGLDFIEDIRIGAVDFPAGLIRGSLRTPSGSRADYRMRMLNDDGFIIVWLIPRP